MIFPIRCFTCNKVIGDKWLKYCELTKNKETEVLNAHYLQLKNKVDTAQNKALNELNIERYCCRRIFLCHIDI